MCVSAWKSERVCECMRVQASVCLCVYVSDHMSVCSMCVHVHECVCV